MDSPLRGIDVEETSFVQFVSHSARFVFPLLLQRQSAKAADKKHLLPENTKQGALEAAKKGDRKGRGLGLEMWSPKVTVSPSSLGQASILVAASSKGELQLIKLCQKLCPSRTPTAIERFAGLTNRLGDGLNSFAKEGKLRIRDLASARRECVEPGDQTSDS